MVTRATCSEMPSSKVKIKSPLWLLVGHLLVTRYNQTFPSISTKKNLKQPHFHCGFLKGTIEN